MGPGTIHVGTSGWQYAHWVGPFYPADARPEELLGHYTGRLDAVEVNNSFQRLPAEKTLARWRDAAPREFTFAVKGSGFITHRKKLTDPETTLPPFFSRITTLGKRMGPVLFQLPPRWRVNPERLEAFLAALPGRLRYAFEFRDESWFSDRVYDLLKARGAAFCIWELAGRRSPREVTADFVYARLHGPGDACHGEYRKDGLMRWAAAFRRWARAGKEVFVFFDNDQNGYAPADALRLKSMLREKG